MSASPVPSVAEVRMAERPAENRRSLKISPTSTGAGANAHVPSIRTGTLRPIYVTFLRHVHQHLQGSLRLLHPGGHIRQFILHGCIFLLLLPLRFQFPDQFHQRLRKNILRPLRLKNADNLSGTRKPQVIRAFWKNRPEASITS